MTRNQFRKKVSIARAFGSAKLSNGSELIRWSNGEWSLRSKDGQTVDVVWDPARFEEFLCD